MDDPTATSTPSIKRLISLTPALAGSVALLAFLLTLPPGLTWDLGGADGGELATAVYTLGLAHSPGYPTYLLVAQAARLVPVASPAHRLNILSALCGAGTVAILAAVTMRLVAERRAPGWEAALAGGLAGLLFGLTELLWSQAIITEVYALASLFCGLLLAMTFWIEQAPDGAAFARRMGVFGLAAGLGMGSHFMVAFMGLFAATYLLLTDRRRLLRPANLSAGAGFALGLSVFAYLPLRAGASPLANWGNPDTFERFKWVVSAAAYSGRFQPRLGFSPARLASLVRVWVEQLSVPGLALSVLGLSLWWDTRRRLLAAALLTIALNFWTTAAYLSADTLPYSYPSLMLLSLAAGEAAFLALARWLPAQKTALRLSVAVGLVVVVLTPLLVRGIRITGQATTEADAYSRRVVESAPPNSLILSDDVMTYFPLLYATAVSVEREDVVPIDVRLLQFDWYRTDLARFHPDLGLDVAAMATPERLDAVGLLEGVSPEVTALFTYPAELPPGYELTPSGDELTYLLVERPPNE